MTPDTPEDPCDWRSPPDFSKYHVCRHGDVKNIVTGLVLKQHLNRGYPTIGLVSDSGKRKHKYVHCLVALTFLENPDDLPTVDHIDRDKQNRHVSNLRWASHATQANNKAHGRTSSTGKPVFRTNPDTGVVTEFRSIKRASVEAGISVTTLKLRCHGKGLEWQFKGEMPLRPGEIFKQAYTDETRTTPIVGASVSNCGRVRMRDGRISSGCLDPSGYLTVTFDKQAYFMHRLIVFAWLPHTPGTTLVNHMDMDKTNNYLSNLEWTTPSGNTLHAAINGFAREIEQFTLGGTLVNTFSCVSITCQETGIGYNQLSNNLQGHTHRYEGYIFAYKGLGNIRDIIAKWKTYNRRIAHYDLNMSFLRVFDGIMEASKKTGICDATIRAHITKDSRHPCMKMCYFRYNVEE